MQRRILCFGDSNTWGVIPRWEASPLPSERYDEHTRWPCVMADCLNRSQSDDSWTLIEEDLADAPPCITQNPVKLIVWEMPIFIPAF